MTSALLPLSSDQPVVALSLDQYQAHRDQAGTIYNTVKAYWPLVVLVAGMAGLTGAQVAPTVKGQAAATAQAVPAETPDIKKLSDSVNSIRKDLDTAVEIISDQKKMIDRLLQDRAKKTSLLSPPPTPASMSEHDRYLANGVYQANMKTLFPNAK